MPRNTACTRRASAYDARMKTRTLTIVVFTALILAACGRQERVREIDWAKSALARNPAYEIVATDETAGVFTVKDTASGTVSAIRLEDLIATPAPARGAKPALDQPAPASADAPTETQAAAAPPEEAPLAAQTTETEQVVATPAASGTPLAEGPGYSISRADPKAPANPAATVQPLEGPGYSITREAPGEKAATHSSARNAEAVAAGGNAVRRTEPIICQGARLMRIDGETLDFAGDALIAEEGCDLYINNARIRAGGVGLIARQARVHIVNSTINGAAGSYEASEGAELYVSRSTFTGVRRRFDTATMTDLGGNDYQMH
jgi:hypothetical protein